MTWMTDAFEGINLTPEAAEKLKAIESQFKVLQRENVSLKIENQRLKDDNEKLKDEISGLYKTQKLVQGDALDEI